MEQPENELQGLLREWSAMPAPDPRLADRVTRSIASKRSRVRGTWRAVFDFAFSSRRLAATGVLLGALLGIGTVEWRAVRTRERLAREMPARYLQWIDPVDFAPVETVER